MKGNDSLNVTVTNAVTLKLPLKIRVVTTSASRYFGCAGLLMAAGSVAFNSTPVGIGGICMMILALANSEFVVKND